MGGIGEYLEAEIVTARGARLVVAAYDGALKFLGRARRALDDGRPEMAAPLIFRAKRVVLYLVGSLDPSAGPVVENLNRLYAYVLRRLGEAALERDAAALDEATRLLTELRSAWAAVAEAEGSSTERETDSALSMTG